jgi:hypothetical protein
MTGAEIFPAVDHSGKARIYSRSTLETRYRVNFGRVGI